MLWSIHSQGICWPVSPERITSSGVDASSSSIFWSYPLFLKKIHMKYVVFMCRSIKIFISNWPRTRKFSQLITGKEDSCFWLFSPWWHVGHALHPIFMVWLVKTCQVSSCFMFMFTLTAEADRVLCQLVTFLTVFFYWMYKMKFTCYQEVLCYSWLVCLLGFWLRNMSLVKVGNTISDGIVFSFHLAWCVRGLKSLKRFWPDLRGFQELHLEW